jgi:hypothetical protein
MVEFGKRLGAECKRLGSATHCLFECATPDDARADFDEVLGQRSVTGWDSTTTRKLPGYGLREHKPRGKEQIASSKDAAASSFR